MKEDMTTTPEDLPGSCRGDLIYRDGDWLFNPFLYMPPELREKSGLKSEEAMNETEG